MSTNVAAQEIDIRIKNKINILQNILKLETVGKFGI